VRVGEAPAAEVRHRVGLAPDDVVQHPEADVLQLGADAEDVVVRADDPDRAVVLEDAARRLQPRFGEAVVGGEVGELVPLVVDRVDLGVVRADELALELKIVRRVGEDHVDRRLRQLVHRGDAIALHDGVEGQDPEGRTGLRCGALFPHGLDIPLDSGADPESPESRCQWGK
jgi:hypothetical protein